MKNAIRTLALASLLTCTGSLYAQEAAAPAKKSDEGKKETFLDVLSHGGLVMFPIGLCSIAMLWLSIDIALRTGRKRMAPETDLALAQDAFRAGDYVGAYQAMKAADSPYASVVRAGLGSVGYGKAATEESILFEVDKVNSTLQTRINYLSVIGVCTPMIGLIGTVLGMIKAFSTLGAAGLGDPGKLAGAIGEVLVATASGLFIAVPAFMMFYFLRNKLQGAIHHVENEAVRLFRNTPYDYLKDTDVGQEETFAALPNWISSEEPAA